MKPRITTDLLRGLLAAYVARECYMYSRIAPSVLHGYNGWVEISFVGFIVAIVIAVQVFVFSALLAQRAPKAIFVCLLLLAVMPIFALNRRGWVISERFVVRQLVALGAVAIAYIYYRCVCATLVLASRRLAVESSGSAPSR